MKNLLEAVKKSKTISIIGMDKNVGKTTTLNYIIENSKSEYRLGLTSIGRDGESEDLVTKTKKPEIYIRKGTIIATAKSCLLGSDFTKEIIDTTGIKTPMGEIIIARALSDGYTELAGPSINADLSKICKKLEGLGCDIVIADGALSRKTFASPSVTKGTILATGASLSGNMEKVIADTSHTVDLLSVEKEEDYRMIKKIREFFDEHKLVFIDKNGNRIFSKVDTVLGSSNEIIKQLNEDVSHVIINGIVVDKLLEDIMNKTKKYKGVKFIVQDGTKLFINRDTKYKFEKTGGIIRSLEKINIVGVSANPIAPYGYRFDNEVFLKKLREKIKFPVFNVMGCD